jgi:hypothetical protein
LAGSGYSVWSGMLSQCIRGWFDILAAKPVEKHGIQGSYYRVQA